MLPTISAAALALRQGTVRSVQLVEQCLARIDQVESRVRAWVLIDRKEALAAAARCDEELRRGQDRGPLHGIPVGIKDIIDVYDWPTACGSQLWQHSIARHDAPVVRRLRQAGAVLLGKTVTTAYASFDPPVTRNPWNLERTPGGSSSGSAAAVAAGMAFATLATQTGGSITRPASYCGVASCKPTYGTVSTAGVLPLAASMDHIGAMARTVAEVAIVQQTISDPNSRPTLLGQANRPPILGRPSGMFRHRADGQVNTALDTFCSDLVRRGAIVREIELPASFLEVTERHRLMMAVEACDYHKERLERHPEDYPPRITSLLQEGLRYSAVEYARTKEHQRQLIADLAVVLAGVDALLCPATTGPAPDASSTGDPLFNSPWSYTGLPVVAFPIGLSSEGLPLGVQLVGSAGGEGSLFALAEWCEASAEPLGEPPLSS